MTNKQTSLAAAITDLGGQWQFRQKGQQQWMNATVPGCNFTDLLANGVIDDPFFGDNENQLQWIEQQDWQYRKVFDLTDAQLNFAAIQLVAEGLDTYCDLYLNGQLVAQGSNMFVGQRIECHSLLKCGENTLEVTFRSPIQESLPKYLQAGFTYPAENDKSIEKLSVYCRKAPCHFGWDWGPRFVTSGIWRNIYLQGINQARIADIQYCQQSLTAQQAHFDFVVEFESVQDIDGVLRVECAEAPELNQDIQLGNIVADRPARLSMCLDNPHLWWPNGLGEACLYHFNFTLLCGDETLDSRTQNIGLRTIEVINQADEMGESFYFKVNGHPVFMKGANYIPADSFVHRVTPERHASYMQSAVDANMNMLRVWGGGIYQDDVFYQLADEHGLLIWQDFMFACSLYPADEAFLDNVVAEAEYNIRRLRNHPCIAMWCGNNEVDMAIDKWQWPEKFGYSDELYQRLKQDYIRLFDQCLPQAVKQLDPQRFYLRSSPIGFWEDDADHKGNHHYWGVWHGEEPFSEYQRRIPRFMSEFGFQSFPMLDSVERFTDPDDRQLESAVMQVHQKHPRGNSLIQRYMQGTYPPPKDFASLLYLSQVQQAQGLKLAFEAHRLNMPFCMGSLYWQFNDTWPAASWSGIDYYGRWKALHYQAKHSFNPQLLVIREYDQQVEIHLINDALANDTLTLQTKVLTQQGETIWQRQQSVEMQANCSEVLLKVPRAELLADKAPEQLIVSSQLLDPQGHCLSHNHYFFVADTILPLQPAELQLETRVQTGLLRVKLQSANLVRQLHLSLPTDSGNFSDNFFDLLPGQVRETHLPLPGLSENEIAQLAKQLRWQSMWDSVQHAAQ